MGGRLVGARVSWHLQVFFVKMRKLKNYRPPGKEIYLCGNPGIFNRPTFSFLPTTSSLQCGKKRGGRSYSKYCILFCYPEFNELCIWKSSRGSKKKLWPNFNGPILISSQSCKLVWMPDLKCKSRMDSNVHFLRVYSLLFFAYLELSF